MHTRIFRFPALVGLAVTGLAMNLSAHARRWLCCGLLGVLTLGTSACVYRVPIQQGNFLESKDIDQVAVGMTQAQVRYVLGTPMVVDPFTKDRWDYVYYLKKGRIRRPEQRHFVVYFQNGTVSNIERSDGKS